MEKNNEPITRQDIMDEVRKLTESNDRWRVQVEAKVNDNYTLLKAHHTALFGNGKPGLDEEIRNIKASQDVLIKLAWIVASTVISIGVAGVIGAMVYLIKVMP